MNRAERCPYCHGTRELQRLDFDPVECPSCRPWELEPADPEHHAPRSEELEEWPAPSTSP